MPLDGIDRIVSRGQSILDDQDSVEAHRNFNNWVRQTTSWLNENFPTVVCQQIGLLKVIPI